MVVSAVCWNFHHSCLVYIDNPDDVRGREQDGFNGMVPAPPLPPLPPPSHFPPQEEDDQVSPSYTVSVVGVFFLSKVNVYFGGLL